MNADPPTQPSRVRPIAIYIVAVLCAYLIPWLLSAIESGWTIGLATAIWYGMAGPGEFVALLAGVASDRAVTWGFSFVPLTLMPVYVYARATTRRARVRAGALQATIILVGLIGPFLLWVRNFE